MATVHARAITLIHSFQANTNVLTKRFEALTIQTRGVKLPKPIPRYPSWYVKKERTTTANSTSTKDSVSFYGSESVESAEVWRILEARLVLRDIMKDATDRAGHPAVGLSGPRHREDLTHENTSFIKEVLQDKYGPPSVIGGVTTYQQSPLKTEPMERGVWAPGHRRTGLIARKIGIYPMWLNNGQKLLATLLQVVDNHVIRYIPPEEFSPPNKSVRRIQKANKYGCLLVGAECADPQTFTKEYCGLFKNSGVMPKKFLGRFIVSPEAAIPPGTPLFASHFKVGEYVDVRGLTVDRGFQGVMKRWKFKGQPASHGVTKTHRRPGNIGGGGEKGRVWPGTKLPGHMGNRYRILKGVKVLRVNTKYNVLWVKGQAIPGATNSIVHIYDTILPLRKPVESPYFPTFYPDDLEEPLPEDIYEPSVHSFAAPTIMYQEEQK